MKKTKKIDKKRDIRHIVIIILIVIAILLFIIIKASSKDYNFSNLRIYKENKVINATYEQKEIIKKYLKKEKFKKQGSACVVSKDFLIKFDNLEIYFDTNCGAYYQNNYTMENYNIKISEDLKKYIISLLK